MKNESDLVPASVEGTDYTVRGRMGMGSSMRGIRTEASVKGTSGEGCLWGHEVNWTRKDDRTLAARVHKTFCQFKSFHLL